MSKTVGGIVIGVILVVVFAGMVSVVARTGGLLGGLIDLDTSRISQGSFTCGATSTALLAAYSGRSWLRLTNVSINRVSFAFTTGTVSGAAGTFAVINQGVTLGTVTSSNNVWDSNESNVNWPEAVHCVADVTSSLVTYIQAR